MIHDLLVAMFRPDGCFHVLGHVGGGFTNDERRGFFSDLKDRVVASDYVEVNDQVAYQMVRPEWVIEISLLDMIAETTRGLPIKKMALEWDAGAARYRIVRRMPLVGLISPQFVRRREDKSVHPADIPLRQVTDLVDVALADRDARQLERAKSEVLRREVATKQLKGQTMVRKLLLWKSNKEADGEFPAYVVHYTDFSPNRKTPLERDIRVSSSREQIDQLWTELAAEAFVKGWVPVGAADAAPSTPAPEDAPVTTAVAKPRRGKKAAEAEPAPPEPQPANPTDEPAPKKAKSRKKSAE
jgi:hypothetical protein